MNVKKRIFSFALVISIVASLFVTVPVMAESHTSGLYTYVVSNSEATITKCDESASGSIVIPSTLGKYPVVYIGSVAFYNCEITEITIPEGVKTTRHSAFLGCYKLTQINIPASLTSIGDSSFYRCESLVDINVDENNPNYSSENGVLFDKNKTTLIRYGEGRTATTYSIPTSVTSIEHDAFYNCDNLTDVYYDGTEKEWNAITIGAYNECLTNATIHFAKQEPEHIIGDANGDGEIGVKDIILLRRFITGGSNIEIHEETADINKDGYVNVKDVILIRRYITGGYGVEL